MNLLCFIEDKKIGHNCSEMWLAYLAHIFSIFNVLNISMQGRMSSCFTTADRIDGQKRK